MTAPARAAVGLVVPMYDEEIRFQEYGKLLVDFIADQAPGSELVFVDDGSSDGTCRLVDELITAHPDLPVRLLRRAHEGKGAAVAAGLNSLVAPLGAFCDLDLSTPLEELGRVIDAAARSGGLAIGSRDLSGSTLVQAESKVREALGRAYNRLLQATVTPGIVDTQCGAKAASRDVWRAVLPYCRQRGFAWDAEVVAVAQSLGMGVQEVPIQWRHDERSKINVGRDGIKMVLQTRQIWRSAREAAVARVERPPIAPLDEVFEGQHAKELIAADRTHWWFRGKAAYVATALRRTGGRREGGVLVDVGAGAGGVTAMIGWDPEHVVVIEGGRALVEHARRSNGLLAVQARVNPLPLAASSAQVLCLLDVIEHLADAAPALAEADRVLADGGRLVINVPAHAWLWSAADEHLGHHRRYNRRLLRAELAAAGFEPVLMGHVFSWLVPFVWAERRLSRGEARLGLDRTSVLIDRTALVLTTLERLLLGRLSLPLGTSLLCVAERASTSDLSPD